MYLHTIYCHHNTVITKLGRHNKTGGLYNYSDPSIYDPTFDTVFNGPSINPCKLVILQIEVCQVTQQHCACYKSDHLNRSSGSARPSFPSSLCFGASWWWLCSSSQLRIWTATWKGSPPPLGNPVQSLWPIPFNLFWPDNDVLFRFIRLLQDDAERRKENLEKMQDSDRSTSDWLTRHVNIKHRHRRNVTSYHFFDYFTSLTISSSSSS